MIFCRPVLRQASSELLTGESKPVPKLVNASDDVPANKIESSLYSLTNDDRVVESPGTLHAQSVVTPGKFAEAMAAWNAGTAEEVAPSPLRHTAPGSTFQAAPTPQCGACGKPVYLMEMLEADGQKYHKKFAKCWNHSIY